MVIKITTPKDNRPPVIRVGKQTFKLNKPV